MAAVRLLPVDARLSGMHWTRYKAYDFARCEPGAPLIASEVSLVASFAPFVFRCEGGACVPYALFSLSGERNAFVSPDGAWMGKYVPARLRGYPFFLSNHPNDHALMVREDAILKQSSSDSLPFLAPHGGLSEAVRKVEQFLVECRSEMQNTLKQMRKVERLGLLVRLKLEGLDRRDKHKLFVIDWKAVNENKAVSAALSKDILLQRVLHAHAVSLVQIRGLRALERRLGSASGGRASPDSDLEDFLDAVGGALRAG